MSGDIIRLVPKRVVDFSTLAIGSSQDLVLADRIDLTPWSDITMLARVHTHSLSNGAGSISILALPDGHTNEDPGLNWVQFPI